MWEASCERNPASAEFPIPLGMHIQQRPHMLQTAFPFNDAALKPTFCQSEVFLS
jgi:hypothetical protein